MVFLLGFPSFGNTIFFRLCEQVFSGVCFALLGTHFVFLLCRQQVFCGGHAPPKALVFEEET